MVAAIGIAIYSVVFNERIDLSPNSLTEGHAIDLGERNPNAQSIRSAADLEALVESKSAFSRSLAIRGLLLNVNERTARRLFRIADGVNSNAFKREIQSIVVEKLATTNPRDSLKFIDHLENDRKGPLVETVFRVWARSDLDGSVNYAVAMDEIGQRSAFIGILESGSVHAERALDIARQLNAEQMYLNYSAENLLQEPVEDPESAFKSFFLQHGKQPDDFSEQESRYLVHVIQSWIARDGVDAIRDAAKQLTTDSARAAMLFHFFVHESDSARSFEVFRSIYAMDTDVAARSVAKWAEVEPRAAFKFASALDDDRARTRLMRMAVLTWSDTNPLSLLNNLNELPESLSEWIYPLAMFSLSDTHPELAAQKLTEFPDNGTKEHLAAAIASDWGRKDIRAALNWVMTNPLGQELSPQGQDLRYSAFRGAFRIDPELALELALEQPLAEDAIGFESALLGQLASEDAEAALELVNYARNWETLKSSYWSIGKAFIQEGKGERAMEMVQGETEEFQTQFFRWMMFDWVQSDAKGLHASLATLPTTEIQALASEMLLWQHERESFLNDEQVEQLESTASNSPTSIRGNP